MPLENNGKNIGGFKMAEEVNEVKVNEDSENDCCENKESCKDCTPAEKTEDKKNCCGTVAERRNADIEDTNERRYRTRAFRDLNDFMNDWSDMFPTPSFTRMLGYDPFEALQRRANVAYNGFNNMILDRRARVYDNADGSADILVDMPGVVKDDVKVTWPSERVLRIELSQHEEDENHRSYRSYTEDVPVHSGLDVRKATAKLTDGQLRVHVPAAEKTEEPDRNISID